MNTRGFLLSVGATLVAAGAALGQYDGKATFLAQAYASGLGSGGPFVFQADSALAGKISGRYSSGPNNNLWNTFCLEHNEYIVGGTTYDAKIDTVAFAGGLGNQTPGNTATSNVNVQNTGGGDSLDARTAFLYSNYAGGTLDNLIPTFSYSTAASGSALQNVIWFLENEISGISGSLETTLLGAANSAVDGGSWSGIGNVRVLNIYNGAAPYGPMNQSQLVIIPLPSETSMAALGMCGLFGLGIVRRRRS